MLYIKFQSYRSIGCGKECKIFLPYPGVVTRLVMLIKFSFLEALETLIELVTVDPVAFEEIYEMSKYERPGSKVKG